MRPGAVIFDMDGVLVDSEPLHARAFRETLVALGHEVTSGPDPQDYVGRSDHELWEDFVRRHRPDLSVAQLMEQKRLRMLELLRQTQPWFPGAVRLVRRLHGRLPLGLASGSERPVIEAVLDGAGIRTCFAAVVSGLEVPRGKPAPDIFLRTAELLQVNPKSCWVVEDSLPGIRAARSAGMHVIAVCNTHPAEDLGEADRVTRDYEQIALWLGLEEAGD